MGFYGYAQLKLVCPFFLLMNFLLTTQDADGSVPFFWGADSEGHLVLSDDVELVKKGCGKSFAPFPKGITQNSGVNYLLITHFSF